MEILSYIKAKVNLPERSIENTINLLSQDASIPFISRYRKEQTGNLNEVEVEQISLFLKEFSALSKRKDSILKSIEEQGALSDELRHKINNAQDITEIEDLYLPFKKKRKTKADTAREAGLEPLAKILMAQKEYNIDKCAQRYINNMIPTVQLALEGAKDIMAEWINADPKVRSGLRKFYSRNAILISKVIKQKEGSVDAQKYRQYFEWKEPLHRVPSHRFLAMYRAEKEQVIRLKAEVEKENALRLIANQILIHSRNNCKKYVEQAIEDAFTRLLKPSFQTEMLNLSKIRADEEAIRVFAGNLEQLLLSPPLGGKRILAIDPGFKSGCKVVCLDESGFLLYNENIYPNAPQKETAIAGKKIRSLINAYKIEAIAIGNGTASRETDFFIKQIPMEKNVAVYVVNEAGASVYSASKVAREEFPDFDITVRGAVSIGRRLADPLAEFVKIDPKSIGVGQYQHEVDQNNLKERLDTVVANCVNRVGVDVNTSSRELLSYVSGIGPALADNIVAYRNENGKIMSRNELKNVTRLGEKAFEQAAGFLRIKDGDNPLDNSAVHPERYPLIKRIAKDLKIDVESLVGNGTHVAKILTEKYIDENLGLHTFSDILKELEKPGRDPRKIISNFKFDPSVKKIEDLISGMKLPGKINNITNFGCFVDIGLKESGLIHISKLAKGFVKDVNSIVKLNQEVVVTVLEVDIEQKRIQLSLIDS